MRLLQSPTVLGLFLLVSAGGIPAAGQVQNGPAPELIPQGNRLSRFFSAALSPDGKYLVTGSSNAVLVWEVESRRVTRRLEGHYKEVTCAAFSTNGGMLGTSDKSEEVIFWDLRTGAKLHRLGPVLETSDMSLSPDGRHILTSHPWSGSVMLRDAVTGKPIKEFYGAGKPSHLEERKLPAGASFLPDGRRLLGVTGDGVAQLWNSDTGDGIRSYGNLVRAAAVDPKERVVVTAGEGGTILWDFLTGEKLRTLPEAPWAQHAVIDPKGDILATALGGDVSLWKLPKGTLHRSIRTGASDIRSLSFAREGMFLVTESWDRSQSWWSVDSGKQMFRLYTSADGGWVVVTPEGYFDGSAGALRDVLRWTVGLRSYPLEAFSEGYYMPGLLARVLAVADLGVTGLPSLSKGFGLPPRVRILFPGKDALIDESSLPVRVAAEDEGGGIGEIRLYHNGKVVSESVEGRGSPDRADNERLFLVHLVPGRNLLRAVGLSQNRIQGEVDEIMVRHEGIERTPLLHVVTVGINKYRNAALDLGYARSDAQSILKHLTRSRPSLFRAIRTKELYDGTASRQNILAALEELRGTAPEDVVVIFLAGHGESIDGKWYFIPHELTFPERAGDIQKEGLSSMALQDGIAGIGARKVLLLLDACKSGLAIHAFSDHGFAQMKTLSRLANATGVHVLAATSWNQPAAELSQLGHGIFTHALLRGLEGQADGNPRDGTITVRELLSYAEARLPELSAKYGAGLQYPLADSRGMDFPIALVEWR